MEDAVEILTGDRKIWKSKVKKLQTMELCGEAGSKLIRKFWTVKKGITETSGSLK